ncbi:RluA family pseudouridine synthase [Candidatus Babeliales bacterium]|nr:RluA family pseudouridine synthase [Candidatus Babeliales bacterium]
MTDQSIKQASTFSITVDEQSNGLRIDKFITAHFSQYSRSFLQKLFKEKLVTVNQTKIVKSSFILKTSDTIFIQFPGESDTIAKKEIPADLNVQIIAKHDDFLIINKPAGLVVHAPNKNYSEVTLSDWVVDAHEEIAHVGLIDRPGIVHRLDKDTSGLMIIPRTNHAHATMTEMFKARKIHKTYLAIVLGHPPATGTIDFFIGRHHVIRNKMHHFTNTTKRMNSRDAVTHYKVLTYFKDYSLVEIKPITGRTHQIRVHFAALGFPLLADMLYGKSSKILKRHALHAHQLEFEFDHQKYHFNSPIPDDLQKIINDLQSFIIF